MIGQAITKNSILLTLFAVTVAAGLAGTELITRDKRAESLRAVQARALLEIIPAERHDNELVDDIIMTDDDTYLRLRDSQSIHIARRGNEVVAFIIPTRAPDGYGGAIDSIVGVNLDGSVAGVRVIRHQETPGLGDKVELSRSQWVLDFNGKSLNDPARENWGVRKDGGIFDQFTGATITPRAVVGSVYNVLLYFKENREALLQAAQTIAADKAGAD